MLKNTNNMKGQSDERRLWRETIRDVRPLRARRPPVLPPAGAAPEPKTDPAGGQPRRPLQAPPLERMAGIDRANAERLKRGLHTIEAQLDLHGMSQAEAHRELAAFVRRSRAADRRCVLVITGRGLGPNGSGILKSSVPRWLEEPELRSHILAIATAQPRHGGAGATYLLLRRDR